MEETIKLVKKAIAAEVTASAFYSLASEATENDETRMVFLELSTMEDDHAQELVNKFKTLFSVSEFDGQAYLDELIKNDAGADIEQTEIINKGTPRQVLELAISMENRAQETYATLADEVVEPTFKQYCLDLAAEEVKHALLLSSALDSLDMDIEDRPAL
ncbi:MAG: ferritin family protein [Magnetococcales bacterium]|nr:ferritin family protein [Magnetococcales bacterium]